MTAKQALWWLIGVSTALRLFWAASVGGYANEAYYYLYAENLDWGFFDHPPMVGVVAAAGLRLAPGLNPAVGLRLGFIAMFAASTWLLARLTSRFFGDRAGTIAAFGLNATFFYGLKVGTFAEPDGPLLFFWLLTLDRLAVVLRAPGEETYGRWAAVGLAWGGAMLSKYYAVLIPAGLLAYLVLRPQARRVLRTPGPYLAVAVGLAAFSPVVAWNATHHWASFAYQGDRAGGFDGFHLKFFAEAVLAQALFLTPWVFGALAVALVRVARRAPWHWSDAEAFLMLQALPALGLFLGVATFRRIMPHWPMIGFVALFPLLGRALDATLAARPVSGRLRLRLALAMAAPAAAGMMFVVQAQTGLFQDMRGRLFGLIKAVDDPTVDTIRWEQIAGELKRRDLLDDPNDFLFTDYWRFSAELAMATELTDRVVCLNSDARSFQFWSRPEDWVGRDGLYVQTSEAMVRAEQFAPWFSRVEKVASFPIVRAGVPVETVEVFRCVRNTQPFRFGERNLRSRLRRGGADLRVAGESAVRR